MNTFNRFSVSDMRAWAGRFGLAGFIFFLVKGLLWLAIPLIAGWWM